jgi:hypothetical protein
MNTINAEELSSRSWGEKASLRLSRMSLRLSRMSLRLSHVSHCHKTIECSRSTVTSWSLFPQLHPTTALLCPVRILATCSPVSRLQNTTLPSWPAPESDTDTRTASERGAHQKR